MIASDKLKRWIFTNIETEGFTRFEDLHVNDLAGRGLPVSPGS